MDINSGSNFGHAVSSAGDFNNDGFADFAAGAFSENSCYVFFGAQDFSKDGGLFSVGGTDLQVSQGMHWVSANSTGVFGWSISKTGDINKDGFTDLIIGSFSESAVYVLFGASSQDLFTSWGTSPCIINATSLTITQGFQIVHGLENNSYFGWSVAGTQDFNGDGYSDFIIGAWTECASILFLEILL